MREIGGTGRDGWTPSRREALRGRLDALCESYDARSLPSDPLQFVHRYEAPEDREAAGFVAASLAYGRVPQILASVETILAPLGERPATRIASLAPEESRRLYRGFRHRFNDGRDIACLLDLIRRMQSARGGLGGFFAEGDPGGPTLEGALIRFSERALSLADPRFYRARSLPAGAGVRFFFPSPRDGSAVKRLNLYLRWMVRRSDGLDVGLWSHLSPSRLLVPLDTHVARIARYLGLTDARQPTWRAVREVTAKLSALDPGDPVRYDFALSRLGILDRCPSRRDPVLCRGCLLRPVCRHWAANAGRAERCGVPEPLAGPNRSVRRGPSSAARAPKR